MFESLLYGALFFSGWLFLLWIGRKFVLWYFRIDEVVSLLTQIRNGLAASGSVVDHEPASVLARPFARTSGQQPITQAAPTSEHAPLMKAMGGGEMDEVACIAAIEKHGADVRLRASGGWEVQTHGSSIVSYAAELADLRQIANQHTAPAR